jgi:hypothetical protein
MQADGRLAAVGLLPTDPRARSWVQAEDVVNTNQQQQNGGQETTACRWRKDSHSNRNRRV